MQWLRRLIVVLLLVVVFGVPAEAGGPRRVFRKLLPHREAVERSLPRVGVTASGAFVPIVRAAAVTVYDTMTGDVIYGEHADTVRSIASLTKMMTAAVTLENVSDLQERVVILPADTKAASTTVLRRGDVVTVDDLLHLLLIGSDNVAARALARISPFGSAGFVQRMNGKALELGLMSTMYADSSGLLAANLSTALDMARLVSWLSEDDYLMDIMRLPNYTIHTRARTIAVKTTDHLLVHPEFPVVAGKTGFTSASGFCFATVMDGTDRIAIVVLGARSNEDRFIEAENLYKWFLRAQTVPRPMDASNHLSSEGIDFLKRQETFRARPYFDSGGWAVGYGFHTWRGRTVTKFYPVRITEEDADVEFVRQLADYESRIPPVQTQAAFDALVSVAYNVGHVNPEITSKLAAGGTITPDDFLTTATVGHRPFPLLVHRRLQEFSVFAGDYSGDLLSK